jgi:hypothetical protein
MSSEGIAGSERPLFGQCARRLFGLRVEDLEDGLRQQREEGGHLGQILRDRGLLTRSQLQDVLRYQADWVAQSMRAEVRPNRFPLPTFLSVCMPAYNEGVSIQDKLDGVLSMLPAFVDRFEVVIVNDGSRDDTASVVAEYARGDRRVRLVEHEVNKGYGAAVTTGLRAARGDLVMFTDSDNQFSLLDLPRLLAQLPGNDVVVGYRHDRADSPIRLLNAWAWKQLIRWMLGVCIRDLDCAYKLFRREVIDQLQMTVGGAGINAEIMAQCCRLGLRVAEVPVAHYPRYHGSPTGASLKVIARAFRELPQLWKYRRPLAPAAHSTGLERAIEPAPAVALAAWRVAESLRATQERGSHPALTA